MEINAIFAEAYPELNEITRDWFQWKWLAWNKEAEFPYRFEFDMKGAIGIALKDYSPDEIKMSLDYNFNYKDLDILFSAFAKDTGYLNS